MKKYALLYFQQINEKFSKWIFPLHEGENIIGSDRDVDIFLYLNKSEDIIDGVHCKIIVNENDIGIISLTSSGYVKREQGLEKIILSPGIKFILIKGTINEIHDFFLSENLENEFQKWNKFILTHENKMKINLNLNRKESYNKSFISNANNNENNINLNSSLNNNLMLNSAKSNKNLNKNISNSVLGSNSKDINRIGFNNFDEVPEDNIINDYKISQLNPNPINLAKNLINKTDIKNEIYETPKKKEELNNNLDINNSNDRNNNKNQMNYNDIINNNIINEKETEINTMKSEIKEEINLSKKIDTKEIKENNSLELFKQASSEYKKNNNEKIINKDEKTLQIIKELLGENNLENIINNTDYKNIKKYDISYKKTKKNKISEGGIGNFDIQVKNNKFINS